MKTQYECRYENLIMNLIVRSEFTSEDKVSYLLDFHQNSRSYYEKLCDFLYMISVGRTDHSLWISPTGEPALVCCEENVQGFLICTSDGVPEFREDLIEQLLYAFRRIEALACPNEGNSFNKAM